MLLISAFTFFGLSAIQNISHFTDAFGGIKITINLSTQEEESETSTNEVKEIVRKTISNNASFFLKNSVELKGKTSLLKLDNGYFEILSPPPK